MALSRLFAVLFMLVAVGCVDGAANEESKTKLFYDKDITPKPIQDKITEQLKQNPELSKFKHTESDAYYRDYYKVTGDADSCMAVTEFGTPYALEINNTLHYVVQSNEFKQRIKETKCISLNHSCLGNVISSNNDNHKETHCREKMGSVSVYVYNEEKNQIVHKAVDISVCCACMYKVKQNDE